MKAGDSYECVYPVTGPVYEGFLQLFGDRNPLHTDERFAREKNFTGKVMHGAILAGFLSHFIGERLPVKNVIVLSYKLSFLKPVYLGDQLTLTGTVAEVFESVNCVTIRFHFKNQEGTVTCKGEASVKII